MSDLTRAMLDDIIPDGAIWEPEEDADFDLLLEGIADNLEAQQLFFSTLSDIRNPLKTTILSDLEKEYGVPTNTLLSEATRRIRLAGIVFAGTSHGTEDDLQSALRNVGFDVYVYQNDPAVDPDIFLNQAFQMVAGGGNAYAGRTDAFAGITGGELLVNGDIFTTSRVYTSGAGSGLYAGGGHGAGEYDDLLIEKQEYPVPVDPADWPMVFFVGGAITRGYWEIETTVYTGNSFLVSQDVTPTGIAFKPDGSKMYMVGRANDRVYEYTLAAPWDFSTPPVYTGNSFSVSGQDTSPQGIAFKPDGSKMYMVGVITDRVYEYTLAAPWDFSTPPVYTGNSFSVSGQDTEPRGIAFKPDGSKMYMVGTITDRVYEYTLAAPWDFSTPPVYTGNSFSVNSQDTEPQGIAFKPDGSKMYMVGVTTDSVYEYTLDNTNGPIITIDQATVDGAREDEFKTIILRYKPLHSWAALIVNFT